MHLQLRLRAHACVLLAATSVLVLAGCSAHATPARGGNEKFVLRSDSWPGNPDYAVTASGVFADTGTFPGIGNGRNQSLARLSGGTFVFTRPATQEKTTRQQTDSRTCAVVARTEGQLHARPGDRRVQGHCRLRHVQRGLHRRPAAAEREVRHQGWRGAGQGQHARGDHRNGRGTAAAVVAAAPYQGLRRCPGSASPSVGISARSSCGYAAWQIAGSGGNAVCGRRRIVSGCSACLVGR